MNEQKVSKISNALESFITERQTLHLSTITPEGMPFASYAPYAVGEQCFYVLLSDLAKHSINLEHHARGSVLLIADESEAKELFALERVNYSVDAQMLEFGSDDWATGIDCLAGRFGKRIHDLSSLSDFKLFKLSPTEGRYVRGFAKAYQLTGAGFFGEELVHMRDGHGHRKREAVA